MYAASEAGCKTGAMHTWGARVCSPHTWHRQPRSCAATQQHAALAHTPPPMSRTHHVVGVAEGAGGAAEARCDRLERRARQQHAAAAADDALGTRAGGGWACMNSSVGTGCAAPALFVSNARRRGGLCVAAAAPHTAVPVVGTPAVTAGCPTWWPYSSPWPKSRGSSGSNSDAHKRSSGRLGQVSSSIR